MRDVRPRDGQSGQALVEMALVLPLLILLLLGILDLGRILNAYVLVSSTSREGVQYAVRRPSATLDDIRDQITSHAVPLDATTVRSGVAIEYSNDNGATWTGWPSSAPLAKTLTAGKTLVHVSVTYPWSAVTSVIGQLLGSGTFTTRATAAMEGSN